MKATFKSILFLLIVIPLVTYGNLAIKKQEKTKTIKKVFSINKAGRVAINNKYGDLKITTWNNNTVEIEVNITVKGDAIKNVEEKLSNIRIQFNTSKSLVEATTIIEKNKTSWSWWGANNNLQYQINYTIKMPKTNSVLLKNNYGNIYLDELFGEANIRCDYGDIDIGSLKNSINKIELDYCSSSSIGFIKNGSIDMDYSTLDIEESKQLDINADYSTITISSTHTTDFNTDYGSIRIDDASKVIGNADYTAIKLGTIDKKLHIDTDYGSLVIKKLSNNFEEVSITSEYTGIKIGVSSSINFNFDINMQYGNFKYNRNAIEFYKKIIKTTKKYYQGFYGKENPTSVLEMNTQYGSIHLKEID